MSKPRATELAQRPAPLAPPRLRISSSSYSDPTHHRPRTERSPRLSNGRTPRGAQSDPLSQKKLGTRIADLESQLGQAQVELKCLKGQLASAEDAKKVAHEQLEKKSCKAKKAPNPVEIQEKRCTGSEPRGLNKKGSSSDQGETSDDVQKDKDVFQVPVESKVDVNSGSDQDEVKPRTVSLSTESPTNKSKLSESALKNDEMISPKSKLDEKEKELQYFREENVETKSLLHEKSIKLSSAESEKEDLTLKLSKVNQELEQSIASEAQMKEKLDAVEKSKTELENEMKMLRVQTEQWKKAADAAALVLAGEADMNERRISERCGSMDKNYGNEFESGGRGYAGSPGLMDDGDDVLGGGKRKGSGIRMFGELWRKKGHK